MREFKIRIEQVGERIIATLLEDARGDRPTIACQSGETAAKALSQIMTYVEHELHAGGLPTEEQKNKSMIDFWGEFQAMWEQYYEISDLGDTKERLIGGLFSNIFKLISTLEKRVQELEKVKHETV
jgi:hypothetical protein